MHPLPDSPASPVSLGLLGQAGLLALWTLLPLQGPVSERPDSDGPGASAAPLALERPGDGSEVCGLGKDFHTGRRRALLDEVGEELLVFRGLPMPRENLAFRQDKTFWYLSGVESPDAALALDGRSGRQILFLPERTERLVRMEGWEGEKWDASDEWVGELTGFEEIRPTEELLDVVRELLQERSRLGVSLHPTIVLAGSYDTAGRHQRQIAADPLDRRPSREEAFAQRLEQELDVETFDVAPTLVALRHVKQPEEIAAIQRASRAGALAMAEAMRSTRPGIGEWDLEALMSFVQVHEGATGPAYGAIVGGGANSCVLHYNDNDRLLFPGEVVLIDYAPELDHYTSDITRTWPVDGTFGRRQAELYEAVLAAQQAGIAAVRPGVTLREVNEACNEVLAEHGFGPEWIRHSACHFVGMEVHDPGLREPLVPGVVFTIEPGLYEEETGIGIRIEDVVVVTEEGCEVLTGLVPKDRSTVEALVAEEGILDRWSPSARPGGRAAAPASAPASQESTR